MEWHDFFFILTSQFCCYLFTLQCRLMAYAISFYMHFLAFLLISAAFVHWLNPCVLCFSSSWPATGLPPWAANLHFQIHLPWKLEWRAILPRCLRLPIQPPMECQWDGFQSQVRNCMACLSQLAKLPCILSPRPSLCSLYAYLFQAFFSLHLLFMHSIFPFAGLSS